MILKGTLTVSQSDWRHTYASFLNFANQEIEFAYIKALEFYELLCSNTDLSLEDLYDSSYTDFQLGLINNALTKQGLTKIYKPKKNLFKKFTNRTTEIDLGDFFISFDKVTNTVNFTSIDFDISLDDVMTSIPFIGQFINMVETIRWPSKPGPVKTIRGATIVYIQDGEATKFYTNGTNPPYLSYQKDIVTIEPIFLKSSPLRKVRIDPIITADTHDQPVHKIKDMELL